jgi:hypothetical protein
VIEQIFDKSINDKSTNLAAFLKRAAAGLLLLLVSAGVSAQDPITMQNLLDRIQIEDLLVRYYYELSQGNAHEMSEYFTEDALLDVDSTIARGRDEIEKLYGGPREARPPGPQNHMLLTNPVINLYGSRATAHVIWTGVENEGVGKRPTLYEQGREDTELMKVDGKWLISKRYISSDSGIPDRFDETYVPRGNPLEH